MRRDGGTSEAISSVSSIARAGEATGGVGATCVGVAWVGAALVTVGACESISGESAVAGADKTADSVGAESVRRAWVTVTFVNVGTCDASLGVSSVARDAGAGEISGFVGAGSVHAAWTVGTFIDIRACESITSETRKTAACKGTIVINTETTNGSTWGLGHAFVDVDTSKAVSRVT